MTMNTTKMRRIIAENDFRYMNTVEKAITNEGDRKQLTKQLLNVVKEKVNIRWNNPNSKVGRIISDFIFKATDRGFSYVGRSEKSLKRLDCHKNTISNAIKYIEQSGIAYIYHNENNRGNSAKNYVIILKDHPNFAIYRDLLNIKSETECSVECVVECAEEIAEIPCESKVEGEKNDSTIKALKSTLKQELNNNKLYITREDLVKSFNLSTNLEVPAEAKSLFVKLSLKLKDLIRNGVSIIHESSFLDTFIQNELLEINRQIRAFEQQEEEKKAEEERKQLDSIEKAMLRNREEDAMFKQYDKIARFDFGEVYANLSVDKQKKIRDTYAISQQKIPFFNWLDGDNQAIS